MTKEEEKKELIPAQAPAELPVITSPGDIYFNLQLFEHVQRVATMFARSNMIPDRFKGNVGDCTIALSMAHRLQADPIMVMQNTYVVHGSPGIQGQFVIALINQSGKFSQLLFSEKKDDSGQVISCTAHANLKESGEKIETELTWEEVVAQGWNKDSPKMKSKWNTMRAQMFRYRAAAFFGRTFCPEVLFGMQTTEELHDVIDVTPDAGDKLNDIIGLNTTKDKISTDFQENLKEELSKENTAADFIVVGPEKEEGESLGKHLGETLDSSSSALESTSQETEDPSPDSSQSQTTEDSSESAPEGKITSDDENHPFNRTKWIACRAASTLQKLVKDHAESWESTTPETKKEFHDKWKRILKAGAAEAWPFENLDAPQEQDETDINNQDSKPLEVAASIYIGNFKQCSTLDSLREYFTDNNVSILNHSEKDKIIAEYDRLMDANQEPKPLVTAQNFISHIYHAEDTSALSMIGMKYAETVDALPEKDQIWKRIDERMADLNGR